MGALVHSPEKKHRVWEKDCFQQVEHMQVPNGTDQVSEEWASPIGMPHPSQMIHGNLS